MGNASTLYVGLDVHKDSMAVVYASDDGPTDPTHLGAIADNLHDNLRAYDEDGVDRNITIVDAIIGIGAQLRSPNEIDSNGEVANVVDAGFAIARAIDRLATAVEEMSSAKASRTETPKSWSASHRRSAEVSRETKAERKLTSRLEA